jgi:ferredoxin
MANVTFTSPKLKKDITFYAIAGDCSTLLSVAQEHKIPLDFECENGECGSCAETFWKNQQGANYRRRDQRRAAALALGLPVHRA